MWLTMVWLGQAAHADVWGYVDAKGAAHFASGPLDERYELFVRGSTPVDAAAAAAPAAVASRQVALPSAASRLIAFFDVSPNYKVVKHHLRAASIAQGVDYPLLQALIAAESGFDAAAVSPRGAVGLMQVMPSTAQRFGVQADKGNSVGKKLLDPKVNIDVGVRYLQTLLRNFDGQIDLVLAAYNAGEGAVHRAGNQVPPYKETQDYVKTVMQLYAVLKPPATVASSTVPARAASDVLPRTPGRSNMVSATQAANVPLMQVSDFDSF